MRTSYEQREKKAEKYDDSDVSVSLRIADLNLAPKVLVRKPPLELQQDILL